MRKALKIILGVVVALIILALIGKSAADARYFSGYDPRLPFNVRTADSKSREDYQRLKLYFESEAGEPVPTLLTFPKTYSGKLPCILFLHGIGQKKEFLDEICAPFNKAGFVMACYDQYMQGERKVEGNLLKQAVAFRQRPRKTVNDTRRLMDYLSTHPDIDPERFYLVGASYGAITGSTVAAFDKRVKAVVLVYGGGDLGKLLSAPMIKEAAGAWHPFAKPIAAFILRPADPIRYVHKIAPAPVLFQNGIRDNLVCPAAAKALQDAAGEPKKITWYNSDHIGMLKEERHIVLEVLEEALNFLLEQDKPHRQPETPDENAPHAITHQARRANAHQLRSVAVAAPVAPSAAGLSSPPLSPLSSSAGVSS